MEAVGREDESQGCLTTASLFPDHNGALFSRLTNTAMPMKTSGT